MKFGYHSADGGQLRAKNFHCDLAPVLEVLGEVDNGHAAGAELALKAVTVGERRDQERRNARRAHTSNSSHSLFTRSMRRWKRGSERRGARNGSCSAISG